MRRSLCGRLSPGHSGYACVLLHEAFAGLVCGIGITRDITGPVATGAVNRPPIGISWPSGIMSRGFLVGRSLGHSTYAPRACAVAHACMQLLPDVVLSQRGSCTRGGVRLNRVHAVLDLISALPTRVMH